MDIVFRQKIYYTDRGKAAVLSGRYSGMLTRAAADEKTGSAEGDTLVGNHYTYIVKCRDGSLYTGWTNDLERRVREHNAGKGAKYTKSRRPVALAYYETFDTKQEAMSREYAIKRMKRKEKLKLVNADGNPARLPRGC